MAKKGQKQSPEHIEKRIATMVITRKRNGSYEDPFKAKQRDVSGDKNPFYGKKHNVESIEKRTKSRRANDGYDTSHLVTPEVLKKSVATRRENWRNGTYKLYGRTGKGVRWKANLNGQIIQLRSSWEYDFVRYCNIANIPIIDYEHIRVSSIGNSNKTYICDFEVDSELYEIGWHDHLVSIKSFEAEGWQVHLIGEFEISLMRMFIKPC